MKYMNVKILDPDDYVVDDYEIDQEIKYKEGDTLLDAVITDIDYDTGNISVEFIKK